MKNRIKANAITTRAEFERAADDLARTAVELRKLEARRDGRIQTVRAEFEPQCQDAKQRIESLTLLAEKFAEEHRDELLPTKVKTGETHLALFGFRLGQPTLKLLSRKWNWEKVLEALLALGMTSFIRTKQEPDKEAMKSTLDAPQLAAVGCRIDQTETFFVEPKEQPSEEAA